MAGNLAGQHSSKCSNISGNISVYSANILSLVFFSANDHVSDGDSDSEDSVITRQKKKNCEPFSGYSESDSSDDDKNDV